MINQGRHPALPDWNDLPDALRHRFVDLFERELGGSNVEHYAGQLALDAYNLLAAELPAPVFPLFAWRAPAPVRKSWWGRCLDAFA